MNEVHSLIDRAERYLATAELLVEKGDYESCVSRAYYAMFYCAEAALLTKGMSVSSHKGVISAFGEHFIKTRVFSKELGRELNRAFDRRQLADYEFKLVTSKEKARESVGHCRTFVRAVSEYLQQEGLL